MTLEELPDWAAELIEAERVARLAFLDESDLPRVLPVTYARAGGAVWSAIDHKPKRASEPARLRYLRRRPEAALCVDRYSDDWTRLAWVQLRGQVQVLPVDEGRIGLDALVERYAPYRERQPQGPLLRLDVESASCWSAQPDGMV